ncbi:824_t:CDS:2 [Dentiscutata erythropus]|uniref:824_t:CDS:1 n=1 Tax=Dentiscutata erythropus TaxID=1348616 RepID=A0A9N9BVZ9_9GLOM|nr:824_t:CDS:2 [Dentiscutata erythropus]
MLLSEKQGPQWIDIRNNKTSWSCVYNSQTSSINHYLGSVYKKYEKKLLFDILICIELFKYSYTGNRIRNTIISKITSLDLIDKVKVAVTDNGFNIVKAIREWKMLSIYKKLSSFFNSSKQNERLEEAQHQLLSRYEDLEANQDDMLNYLLELLKPIEEATEWLSSQKYCMLSLIYPTMQVLKYDYVVAKENDEGILFLFFC